MVATFRVEFAVAPGATFTVGLAYVAVIVGFVGVSVEDRLKFLAEQVLESLLVTPTVKLAVDPWFTDTVLVGEMVTDGFAGVQGGG